VTTPVSRPRLFTTHGTVLYVESTSGELRHGPLDGSPANARLVSDGRRGQIMYDQAGSLSPIACLADRSITIDSAAKYDAPVSPTVFQLVQFYQRWVGLTAAGRFLSALPDGRLTLTGPICRAWESFRTSAPILSSQKQMCGESLQKSPSLAISCVETRDVTMAVRAIERTVQCINVDTLYWFSNRSFPKALPGIEVVNITIRDFTNFTDDINRICLRLMPRVITTDFNLTIQPDGFAVNPQSWDDRFWDYDYIGAPWPAMYGPGPIVGNGGFTLRSRKLYDALHNLRVKWSTRDWEGDDRLDIEAYYAVNNQGEKWLPEDIIISLWYRDILETRYGIRFCPPEFANKFSVETVHEFTQYWLGRSFGFHGIVAAPYYGVTL
jgi:hypothetical protein